MREHECACVTVSAVTFWFGFGVSVSRYSHTDGALTHCALAGLRELRFWELEGTGLSPVAHHVRFAGRWVEMQELQA